MRIKAFLQGFWEGSNPLFLLACGFYAAGAAVSAIGSRWKSERAERVWMPVYQGCMRQSLRIQNRFGFTGPWSPPIARAHATSKHSVSMTHGSQESKS